MVKDFKCPFCGSAKLKVENPFVELNKEGKYEKTTKFCCRWQEQNNKYTKSHFIGNDDNQHQLDPTTNPKGEKIIKW